MTKTPSQMQLFRSRPLNPTYEIKRQIRIGLGETSLSRDQVVDEMNALAAREGMRETISKTTFDNWTKDSAPDRLPSPKWLPILCSVLDYNGPIEAMLLPLGAGVIGPKEMKVLQWANAELERKRAAKKARAAMQILEV
jgi:hypothetical protein